SGNFCDHFGQRLKRGAKRFSSTSTMIGYHDGVESVVDAHSSVLACVDALDDELALPQLPQSIDERPVYRHARCASRKIGGHGTRTAARSARMTRGALREVLRARPEIRLAVAARDVVDGERDHC